MNLNKEQKREIATNLADELKQANGIFFASYQGLKFHDMAGLRTKLAPSKTRFRVVRNTIVDHALKGAGISGSPIEMKGPTAIAIQNGGDIVESAKVLAAYEKEFPALKIKACYSSNTWFNVDECKRLATLGTRAETISKLAGNLYSCVSQIASVLQAPMRDLAFVLQAVEEKKKGQAAA